MMPNRSDSTESPPRLRRGAGIMLYRRTRGGIEFLLLKSTDFQEWSFPKGHIDPGESVVETARREVREEAGLTSRDYRFDDGFSQVLRYTITTRSGRAAPKEVTAFLAEVIADATVKLSDEHDGFEWSSPAEVAVRVVHDDLRALFASVSAYLKDGATAGDDTTDEPL